MIDEVKELIGMDCIIYTITNNSKIFGIIKNVSENSILVQKKDNTKEVVNLDFVIRVREHPKGKNGKKKVLIFD